MNTPLAGCVITNADGAVLLLHRNTPRLTQWELPGGKVEANETAAEAARRETLEEIGVQVGIVGVLGNTQFNHDGRGWEYTWFRAEILSGSPRPCEPDTHDEVRYFDLQHPETIAAGVSVNITALTRAIRHSEVTL